MKKPRWSYRELRHRYISAKNKKNKYKLALEKIEKCSEGKCGFEVCARQWMSCRDCHVATAKRALTLDITTRKGANDSTVNK